MADLVTSVPLSELEDAAALIYAVMQPTPQFTWPKLGQRVGCKVWVKHENHTPTGAFKVRGGLVYLDRLARRDPKVAGLVSATRGNHGQSISFAASRAGIPATIYVPLGNSPDQNTAMQSFGARVIEVGKDFDEAREAAICAAARDGLHLVKSFHRDLVVGVASYALELFRAAGALDAVYVAMGMGSGICGLIAARDALGLKTDIIGVSASNAPAMAQSVKAGRRLASPSAHTFADGLATREPDAEAIASICQGAADVVMVSEDEIAEAVRAYYDDTHQVAEGAGAGALAALLQQRDRMRGRNVGVILSGGNIERSRFMKILSGSTPVAG